MLHRIPLLACAGLVLSTSAALAATGFVNLGAGVEAYAVNADGSVITGTANGACFVWTQSTGLVNIGGLTPQGFGGSPSISYDGMRIAGTNLNAATNLGEAAYYDRATSSWHNLGGIGGSSDNSTSSGWSISGDGQSVVGLGWVDAGTAHAVQWRESTGLVDLGSTVADRSTRANAANMNGSVVVGWQDGESGFRQAAVWNNGVQTLITTDVGDPVSEADAVSSTGEWVVGSGGFATNGEAWRWSAATGVEGLGHLNPSFSGGATGVSGDGSVIVGYDRPFGPALFGEGFIWTEATGMVNLTDYVQSLGIDTEGVVLSLPLGISADGRTIVGIGRGETTPGAFGWSVTIPSPSSAVVIGLGALVGIRRRR